MSLEEEFQPQIKTVYYRVIIPEPDGRQGSATIHIPASEIPNVSRCTSQFYNGGITIHKAIYTALKVTGLP